MAGVARSAKSVMNLIHMSVTHATLKVFDVYAIDTNSQKRSRLDLTLETSSARYKLLQSIAIGSLIIVVIGYPLLTIAYYLKSYSKANTPEALEKFSNLTGGFNINGWGFLWESIVIIRKVVLVLVVSFVTGPVAQLMWASTTLILSVFLLAALMPYRKRFINYLQYVMVLTSLGTLAIGFLIRIALDEQGDQAKVNTLSNVVLVFQLTLLLLASIVLVSVAPGALKSLYMVLFNNRPQWNGDVIQTTNQRRDGWTITQSPLHDKRGIVLPNHRYQISRLLLQHGHAIAFSSLALQKDNHRLFKGTRVNKSRKRNTKKPIDEWGARVNKSRK